MIEKIKNKLFNVKTLAMVSLLTLFSKVPNVYAIEKIEGGNVTIESLGTIIKGLATKFQVFGIIVAFACLTTAIGLTSVTAKYFEDITIIPVPKAISKTKMIHTKDAILVDDYAGNLREWESEEGIPVRFSLKGNGKGFLVVKELKELIDMF